MRHITLLILSTCVAVPAAAGVKSATPSGFDIENKAVVSADPAETYAALTRVGEWWHSEHTYSGNAANMTLEAKAGGCFCDVISAGGGTIEHGRVISRSEEHTSELQTLMRNSYAVLCLQKKTPTKPNH